MEPLPSKNKHQSIPIEEREAILTVLPLLKEHGSHFSNHISRSDKGQSFFPAYNAIFGMIG